METTASQILALVFGVVAVLTTSSFAMQLPVEDMQPIAHKIPSDNFLPSEITSSVAVNQMMLLRILNESSSTCSLHEEALAVFNARQEEAREQLQRSVEIALMTIQEKKETAVDEVIQQIKQAKKEITSFKESAINELTNTKQRIREELNGAKGATTKISEASVPGKKFELHRDSVMHREAMDACEGMGGRIAIPENKQEDDELLSLIKKHYPGEGTRRYWIGADDREEEGVWVNSNTGLPLTYTNFGDGEPNNYGGDEDCVTAEPSRMGWNDFVCHRESHGYLCEFTSTIV